MFSLYDPNNNTEDNKIIELQAGSDYKVFVRFSSGENAIVGGFRIPVIFSFQSVGENPDTFTIARSIVIFVAEDHTDYKVHEASPFKGNEWPKKINVYPPLKQGNISNRYPIPYDIVKFLRFGLQDPPVMNGDDHQILFNLRKEVEPGHITLKNYGKFWHIVLWLEEMGQTLGLQRYNMENVTLNLRGRNLELFVPGLAEKRPSIIVGDMLDIRIHEDHTAYRGNIKRVNDRSVDIGDIDEELLDIIEQNPKIEMDVRFLLGRLCFERMHEAVDKIVSKGIVQTIFPEVSLRSRQVPQPRTIRDGEFYNQMIVTNPEQKTAVLKILNASSLPAPYIVFGPPGTGKTVTIVEAILQLKNKTNSQILVCAPANAACNMLTSKLLMHCNKNELIRIMSNTVDVSTIHQDVLEYSNYIEDGEFYRVDAAKLKNYRIIITTLIHIGRYSGMLKPDIVFIDEAAQACEPEVDCALAMIEKGKQIILAGDPRQLGPSTSSLAARRYGLGVSLLERLMDLELYKSQDSNYITMLRQNFRSHSTILKLPNELFYQGQLQAAAPNSENDPIAKIFVYEKIDELRKGKNVTKRRKGKAVEFCNIISKESRQGRSPSYFNGMEMQMVLNYVKALISLQFENSEDNVLQEQIGVVTPYIRQVYKVREILRNNNFEGVEVGTTETFQGREKRIIIISTVRAQQDLLLHDKQYNLGFVRNEKRFNVALTRAMSKLIIIGCGHVLATDAKWLSYMELCENLNGFCGAPFARRTREVIEEITSRFNNVKMIDSQYNH
nr:RNA helicase Mov10l1-like [Leptinotarsa decemlineata]